MKCHSLIQVWFSPLHSHLPPTERLNSLLAVYLGKNKTIGRGAVEIEKMAENVRPVNSKIKPQRGGTCECLMSGHRLNETRRN